MSDDSLDLPKIFLDLQGFFLHPKVFSGHRALSSLSLPSHRRSQSSVSSQKVSLDFPTTLSRTSQKLRQISPQAFQTSYFSVFFPSPCENYEKFGVTYSKTLSNFRKLCLRSRNIWPGAEAGASVAFYSHLEQSKATQISSERTLSAFSKSEMNL